jgi:hypothetical protein
MTNSNNDMTNNECKSPIGKVDQEKTEINENSPHNLE